jgi:uncharacterized protein (TIGR02996 family)
MTDRDALLAGVLNDPADETARLVLADYLEENGEPDLGRFIRAAVTAARFRDRGPELEERELFDAALGEVAAQVVAGNPVAWVADLGLGPRPLTSGDGAAEHVTDDRVTVRIGPTTAEFERGMVVGLTLTLGEWYDVAGRALAAWPVERVSVRDVPGLSVWVSPPTAARPGWLLTGVLKLAARRVPLAGSAVVQSLSPVPFLVEPAEELRVEDGFLTRGELVAGVTAASVRVVDELKEMAGDRWPRPPRSRRGP